jgi:hypothetical protein
VPASALALGLAPPAFAAQPAPKPDPTSPHLWGCCRNRSSKQRRTCQHKAPTNEPVNIHKIEGNFYHSNLIFLTFINCQFDEFIKTRGLFRSKFKTLFTQFSEEQVYTPNIVLGI